LLDASANIALSAVLSSDATDAGVSLQVVGGHGPVQGKLFFFSFLMPRYNQYLNISSETENLPSPVTAVANGAGCHFASTIGTGEYSMSMHVKLN